ncbi:MAG: hypothetical protein LM576_01825 [Thermofilum sp.]|nr:hypothetical protein [Thermofilum sp.]
MDELEWFRGSNRRKLFFFPFADGLLRWNRNSREGVAEDEFAGTYAQSLRSRPRLMEREKCFLAEKLMKGS